jgi:hypothetical protein
MDAIHWINQIDRTTEEFIKNFGSLSTNQLNWKPNPETWSIAQNIDHLIVINESYFPIFSELKEGTYQAPFAGKIGFIVSFMGNTILNSVKPDRKKKRKTFSIWEPGAGEIPGNILKRFADHQISFRQEA